MYNKNTNNKDNLSHLEDAIYNTPPASSTDFTGFVPSHPETKEKADNISKMMNVPTSPPSNSKK